MQTVLYSEKGSSGDCGDHQMAHLPQLGHFFPELIHGCWDESEMIGCGSPNWGSSRPCRYTR
uniref:Uncharacterized protein n=1 Tax=Oryza barthii TaxID=65489 RepID=A0A0D3EXS9_9ORYZ